MSKPGPSALGQGSVSIDGVVVYVSSNPISFGFTSNSPRAAYCKAKTVWYTVINGKNVTAYFVKFTFSGTAPDGWDENNSYNTAIYEATDGSTCYIGAEYQTTKPGETQYFTVQTLCTPSSAATTSGGGTYEAGQSVTIRTAPTNAKNYVFKYWRSSTGDFVYTKEHTFVATCDIVWLAVYAKVKHTGLVLYSTDNKNVIHSTANNLVVHDE